MIAARMLTAGQIAAIAGGRVVSGDAERACPRISRDTRTMAAGDAFLAIRGPNHDGHAHLASALARGASALVVSEADGLASLPSSDVPVVLVTDTIKALQDVARHVSRESGALVVAVVEVGQTVGPRRCAPGRRPRRSARERS